MTKHTDATRQTVITNVEVMPAQMGDPAHLSPPPSSEKTGIQWLVFITYREGFFPERTYIIFLDDEAEVQNLKKELVVGIPLEGVTSILGEPVPTNRRSLDLLKGLGVAFRSCFAGDDESPLAFDTLREAGLSDRGPTQLVRDFLGPQRIQELRNEHEENWGSAAVFEYCWLNLPHSSPAYLASAYQYNWYIAQDDFAAGYLWRDLESAVSGVEKEAANAIAMRQKAGKGGRKASARARKERIISLLEGMEQSASRNPDVVSLGPSSLAALGLGQAIAAKPALWRQGRGQIQEYIGELRRGEAGEALRERYLALTSEKTA